MIWRSLESLVKGVPLLRNPLSNSAVLSILHRGSWTVLFTCHLLGYSIVWLKLTQRGSWLPHRIFSRNPAVLACCRLRCSSLLSRFMALKFGYDATSSNVPKSAFVNPRSEHHLTTTQGQMERFSYVSPILPYHRMTDTPSRCTFSNILHIFPLFAYKYLTHTGASPSQDFNRAYYFDQS